MQRLVQLHVTYYIYYSLKCYKENLHIYGYFKYFMLKKKTKDLYPDAKYFFKNVKSS